MARILIHPEIVALLWLLWGCGQLYLFFITVNDVIGSENYHLFSPSVAQTGSIVHSTFSIHTSPC